MAKKIKRAHKWSACTLHQVGFISLCDFPALLQEQVSLPPSCQLPLYFITFSFSVPVFQVEEWSRPFFCSFPVSCPYSACLHTIRLLVMTVLSCTQAIVFDTMLLVCSKGCVCTATIDFPWVYFPLFVYCVGMDNVAHIDVCKTFAWSLFDNYKFCLGHF